MRVVGHDDSSGADCSREVLLDQFVLRATVLDEELFCVGEILTLDVKPSGNLLNLMAEGFFRTPSL